MGHQTITISSARDMDPIKELLESSESSIQGMTARRAVFKLAEAIAVVKRSRSWEWIGDWMISRGVKSKDGAITPRVLANYLSAARKDGLIDESRVDLLARKIDERLRVETLSKIGQDEAVKVLNEGAAPLGRALPVSRKAEVARVATPSAEARPQPAPEPDFETIREAILKNMSLPDSKRLALIRVNGREMIVPIAAQAKVRDGKIQSVAELHEAMSKRR